MSLWPRAHREVLCCGVLFSSVKMMRVIRPKKKQLKDYTTQLIFPKLEWEIAEHGWFLKHQCWMGNCWPLLILRFQPHISSVPTYLPLGGNMATESTTVDSATVESTVVPTKKKCGSPEHFTGVKYEFLSSHRCNFHVALDTKKQTEFYDLITIKFIWIFGDDLVTIKKNPMEDLETLKIVRLLPPKKWPTRLEITRLSGKWVLFYMGKDL